MKKQWLFTILVTVFSISFSVSAMQEKFIKHTVSKGETITQISQKYKVTPYDIYKLNPDSQNGIQLNSVLLIPATAVIPVEVVSEKKVTTKTSATSHVAQPKETLYSISKQYNVSVETIQNANSDALKNGLKIGQTIVIPVGDTFNKSASATVETPKITTISEPKAIEKPAAEVKTSGQYHVIQPKETKYSISKKYNVSIEELEKLNPQIVDGFPIGLKLKLPTTATAITTISEEKPVVVEKPKVEISNNTPIGTSGKRYFQEYLVKPKDTSESIAADFGITEIELMTLNPELKKGIKLGMILRVPKISEAEKKKS